MKERQNEPGLSIDESNKVQSRFLSPPLQKLNQGSPRDITAAPVLNARHSELIIGSKLGDLDRDRMHLGLNLLSEEVVPGFINMCSGKPDVVNQPCS